MTRWMFFGLAIINFTGCFKPPEKSAAVTWEKAITNKYWKLISIKGQIIHGDFAREPSMTLQSAANLMKGNGGCNPFTAKYKTGPSNSITFSNIVSSNIICSSSETQKEFFHTLNTTDSYVIDQDTLFLKINNRDELARLEAVYF